MDHRDCSYDGQQYLDDHRWLAIDGDCYLLEWHGLPGHLRRHRRTWSPTAYTARSRGGFVSRRTNVSQQRCGQGRRELMILAKIRARVMAADDGFTMVELLVASAIMTIICAAAGSA